MSDDVRRAVAELAASQHSAISRRQAAALGFSSRRAATALRAGWFEEPVPGVLVSTASPSSWLTALKVATLAGGGHAVASHRAAARLHKLDGFAISPIEVSITRENHRYHATNGVIVHHVQALERCDLVEIDGIACTGLARTLADIGAVVNALDVRRALIDASRRGTSLVWIRETVERLHRPGPTGTMQLLRQLDAIPAQGRVPDSWFEELLALCLDDPSLPEVIPQYEIRTASGAFVARADLGIPAARLGLEGHSREFHFGPDAEALDEDRDLRVAACGWELLYLGWYASRSPQSVLEHVRRVVEARMSLPQINVSPADSHQTSAETAAWRTAS